MKIFIVLIALCSSISSVQSQELGTCCRYCTQNSKPCGNSCIPISWNCKKGEGCACSSANPRPGQGVIYQQGFSDGYNLQWQQRKPDLKQAFHSGYQDALGNLKKFIIASDQEHYSATELFLLIEGIAHTSSLLNH